MSATPYLVEKDPGYFEYQLPISLKAVIIWKGRVLLLKNERDEWELPGGKLELGEDVTEALRREIVEELSWEVAIGQPLFAWVYPIRPDRHVFVLAYLATYEGTDEPKYSDEHSGLALVERKDLDGLNMPDGYKVAVELGLARASNERQM